MTADKSPLSRVRRTLKAHRRYRYRVQDGAERAFCYVLRESGLILLKLRLRIRFSMQIRHECLVVAKKLGADPIVHPLGVSLALKNSGGLQFCQMA